MCGPIPIVVPVPVIIEDGENVQREMVTTLQNQKYSLKQGARSFLRHRNLPSPPEGRLRDIDWAHIFLKMNLG